MTGDQLVPILAWFGLVLWATALVLFVRHKTRSAAALNALLAIPFLAAPLSALVRWRIDPPAYVRQYGAAALRELPLDATVLGVSLLILLACVLMWRAHRLWAIVAFVLNAAGLFVLFYFAYFFHIF